MSSYSAYSDPMQPTGGLRYVDRRRVGVGQKVENSLCGAVFGIVLFLAAFPLIFWNEGRAVDTHNMLMEGKALCVESSATRIDSGNDGSLVHVTGPLNMEVLTDEMLGVGVKTVVLSREVEMYQWREHKETKTVRDPHTNEEIEETRTSYNQEWSSTLIDSRQFRDNNNYRNPSHFPLSSQQFTVNPVLLGSFTLSKDIVEKISVGDTLQLSNSIKNKCQAPSNSGHCVPRGEYLYFREGQAVVGDVRVRFRYHASSEISVVGKQRGQSLVVWKTKNGNTLALVEDGDVSSDEMFDNEISSNNIMTWAIRVGGFFMMFVGLQLAIDPILKVVSIVPFFGGFLSSILGFGTTVVIFLVSLALTLVVVAIGWFFARPLLSITLFAIAAGTLYFARSQQQHQTQQTKMEK